MYLTSDAPEQPDPEETEGEPATAGVAATAAPQYGTVNLKPTGANPIAFDAQESAETQESLNRIRKCVQEAQKDPKATLDPFSSDEPEDAFAAFADLDAEEKAFALALLRRKVRNSGA
jgi:hypothetical protein